MGLITSCHLQKFRCRSKTVIVESFLSRMNLTMWADKTDGYDSDLPQDNTSDSESSEESDSDSATGESGVEKSEVEEDENGDFKGAGEEVESQIEGDFQCV